MAFLHGIHIDSFSDATLPCKASTGQLLTHGADAVENFMNDKIYDGTLDVADFLATTSPVARNCTKSIDQLSTLIYNYVYSFDGFQEWITQIKDNVLAHFTQLSVISADLSSELSKKSANFTKVGDLSGQLVYYTFKSNVTYPGLTYTRADPLAPAPMNEYVWNTLESTYEFLTNARFVNETVLSGCQNALLNMALFQSDAYNNFAANSIQESVFLTLDSFVFLRPSVEHCYESGVEISATASKAYARIEKDPHTILDNFNNNMFHVVSGSIATYAQIYHRDIISLSRVFGGVVYRTLVTE